MAKACGPPENISARPIAKIIQKMTIISPSIPSA